MGQNASPKGIFTVGDRQFVEDYYKNLKKLRNERDRLRVESPNSPEIKELTKRIDQITGKFSTFSKNMKKRIEALDEDLTFIFEHNKLLKDLKLLQLPSFVSVTGYAEHLGFPDFETVYEQSKIIPDYSTWKVFEKKAQDFGGHELNYRSYWLSKNELPQSTSRDDTIPEFAIIGIKGKYPRKNPTTKKTEMIDKRKILTQAVKFEYDYESFIEERQLPFILPKDESESLSILEIYERLKNFKHELKQFLKKKSQSQVTYTVYKRKEAQKLREELKDKGIPLLNFHKRPKRTRTNSEILQAIKKHREAFPDKGANLAPFLGL